jgi:hypothetical protein
MALRSTAPDRMSGGSTRMITFSVRFDWVDPVVWPGALDSVERLVGAHAASNKTPSTER